MDVMRPEPPSYASPGARWVPLPDRSCRPQDGTKRCRARAGFKSNACGRPAVAEMNRGLHRGGHRADSWWAYCAPHFAEYFRWVENGVAYEWVQRPIESTP